MKTFKDLVFGKRNSGGVRARMDFDNGFAISVIAGEHPYSTPRVNNPDPDFFEEFEVAVFTSDGDWATRKFLPGLDDDVVGWQNRGQINALMLLIQSKK